MNLEKDRVRLENEKQCEAQVERLVDSDQYTSEKHDVIKEEYRAKLIEAWSNIDHDVEERRNTQFAIITNLARLSPVCCFIRPLAEISRTGWLRYQDYIRSAARYQNILNGQVFNKEEVRRSKGGTAISLDGDLRTAVPSFIFRKVQTKSSLRTYFLTSFC